VEEYRVRRTLFEHESTFVVRDGALVRSVDGVLHERVPLAEVRRVALSYQPLARVDRWVCSVETPRGRVWLPSASFTGVGQTEDRRATFRPFVEAVSVAVAAQAAATGVRFVKGGNVSAYFALAMAIVLAVMAVLLVLGAMGSMLGGGLGAASWAILPTLVVSLTLPMAWRIWRLNGRRVFDPKALPPEFAPLR
jgi:hypothetical protein